MADDTGAHVVKWCDVKHGNDVDNRLGEVLVEHVNSPLVAGGKTGRTKAILRHHHHGNHIIVHTLSKIIKTIIKFFVVYQSILTRSSQ